MFDPVQLKPWQRLRIILIDDMDTVREVVEPNQLQRQDGELGAFTQHTLIRAMNKQWTAKFEVINRGG